MGNLIPFEGQLLNATGRPLDPKKAVGTGQEFETIGDLLLYPDLLTSGILVEDYDYSVTWQVYLDPYNVSSEPVYKARLYDGTFYVRACAMYELFMPVMGSSFYGLGIAGIDGVALEENDFVLVAGFEFPQMHGIWIAHENEAWERHPIFDDSGDNLSGVTFVVTEGTVYSNTQWRYVTRGDVTPTGLCDDYSLYGTDPVTWATYTWLNFEMIGGQHPVHEISTLTPNIQSNNYLNIMYNEGTSPGVTSAIPGKTYVIRKDVDGVEGVTFPTYFINHTTGDPTDVPLYYVLMYAGDWIDYTLGTNNGSDYFIRSNRYNRLIVEDDISRDGQLSTDVPTGYYTYNIYGMAVGVSGSNPVLKLGTTAGGTDITASTEFPIGELVSIAVAKNTITEIYVAETSHGTWNGATLTFYVQIVKDDL